MKTTGLSGRPAGIFLISLSGLVVEIAMMRIFSVTAWYHFSFMVISIAMLGFAASGAFLALFPGLMTRDAGRLLAWLSIAFSAASTGCLFLIDRVRLDPYQVTQSAAHVAGLLAVYAALAAPFFFAGSCVVILFCHKPADIGRIYFFDLLGAGCGCFLAIFLIPLFSNAGAVAAASALGLLAALSFNENRSKKTATAAWVLLALSVLLMLRAPSFFQFKPAESKTLSQELSRVSPGLRSWNAFSQVDVVADPGLHYAPGLSPRIGADRIPPQILLYIDADANTPITRFTGDASELEFLGYIPSALAYELKKNAAVCVIGAGGGYDVLTALAVGDAASVRAIEINPNVSGLVTGYFGEFAGNLYDRPDVRLEINEGRSFIHNTPERFDVIQISLVDTWAAASVGAYSLTENYLYTTEAFSDYIEHLSADGVLTVTRWMFAEPKEILRLVTLSLSALEGRGVERPEEHIVIAESQGVGVLLIKKSRFLPSEVAALEMACRRAGFQMIHAPGVAGKSVFHALLNSPDKEAFYASSAFDITPPTDDKPFFFHYNTARHFDLRTVFNRSDANNLGYSILFIALAQAAALSLIFIVVPLCFRKKSSVAVRTAGRLPALVYFSCLGAAFMFVEVSLVQKFILFLGQPVYALSVVLFSLLVFSGLGSLLSARLDRAPGRHLRAVLSALSLAVFIYSFVLARLPYEFIGAPLVARVAVSAALLAPLGLLMGMPLPMGMRWVERSDPALVPWSWGINGCFSVLGSIASVILAMSGGFTSVLWAAAGLYGTALIFSWREARGIR